MPFHTSVAIRIKSLKSAGSRTSNFDSTMNLFHKFSYNHHEVQLAAIKAERKIDDKKAMSTFNHLLLPKTCFHRENIAEVIGGSWRLRDGAVLAEAYKSA